MMNTWPYDSNVQFKSFAMVMSRLFIPENTTGKGECSFHPFEVENHVSVMLRTFHFTPLTIHAIRINEGTKERMNE